MRTNAIARRLAAVTGLALALLLVTAGASVAAGPELQLRVTTPDTVTAGQNARVQVVATNVGDQPLSGDVTIVDTVPAEFTTATFQSGQGANCTQVAQTFTCTQTVDGMLPRSQIRIYFDSTVDGAATGTLANHVEISGGGTTGTETGDEVMRVSPPDPFAVRTFAVGITDARGSPSVSAGTHPAAITTSFSVPTMARMLVPPFVTIPAFTSAAEQFKDVTVHLPQGLVGVPTAAPRCTTAQLAQLIDIAPGEIPQCPQDSQVGTATIIGGDEVPVYNLVPPHGSPAAFGLEYESSTVLLLAKLRPDDNGIDIVEHGTSTSIPLPEVDVTFWGVPADSSHDYERHLCLNGYAGNNGSICSTDAARVRFLRLPTSCPGRPLPWGIELNSYLHPNTFVDGDTTTPATTDCELLPFDPTFDLVPSLGTPHTATGLDATVAMPQGSAPEGRDKADVRTTVVTLPDDMTINPSSADGLQACSDTDLRLRKDGASNCPDASKLGTVTLSTPLLDHQIGGSVLLRSQNSDDPASGELFRIAIEIRSDDDGIDIKLPGSIRADPSSGTLTTTFDDLPQLPFGSLTLHFKSGPRAPLTSPRSCGTKFTTVTMTSWGGQVVDGMRTPLTISGDGKGGACAADPFAPTWRAGIESPVAGSSSPFHVALRRTDADQEFRSLTVKTPKGLLARVKAATQCSDASARAGDCPASSLIGHATVGAGVGSNPFYVTNGRVYLTTPYGGGEYGLAVVVDAIAGPFNLGRVVVRQAIHVDPRTAQLSVVSDPFPPIVKGVPLRIRDIRVAIDKPHFMVAPTNCSKQQVDGTATSVDGASAALTSRFQVGSCKSLKFAPKLSLSVGAKGRTTFSKSTPFKAVLTQTPGQSNLKSVKVSLPETLAALIPVVDRACTLAEYNADRCDKARAGSAVAVTPLLKTPLRGGAFFVRHPGRPLPDLMVRLRGDIAIDLVGRVTIPGGKRLATNFDTIPDAPVSKFTLSLVAGSHGPLGVSVNNLCTSRNRKATADVVMRGQNGDAITRHQALHIRGCGGTHRKHR